MANKNLFQSSKGRFVPATNTVNRAGGVAYSLPAKHALAQYASTGCLSQTYYVSANKQLDEVLDLCNQVEPEFVARTAIYARQRGFMKDMPALLLANLATRDPALLNKVFGKVIDNGRMVRNFVQILRSGQVGRKSLGTRPKKLVQNWINSRNAVALFKDSVGSDPSIADVIKMVHPRPETAERKAFYGYLISKEYNHEALPSVVRNYEAYKAGNITTVPENLEFRLLTALNLTKDNWTDIARTAPWHMTRMNLNTFLRHGVYEDKEVTKIIADRLKDPEAIVRSRVFPYQLLAAFLNTKTDLPFEVREALQDALDVSLINIPAIEGQVYVLPDVSGSMSWSATGGYNSKMRCIDVAALVSSAFLAKNKSTGIVPFGTRVCDVVLNPRDSVMTNAQILSSINGGGTNCSAPLAFLNANNAKGDLVVYVSDNESWVDTNRYGRGTATLNEWSKFKARNPNAKMVCIDVVANAHTQAEEREDILNVGGFSDQVFTIIADFAAGRLGSDHWVGVIDSIKL